MGKMWEEQIEDTMFNKIMPKFLKPNPIHLQQVYKRRYLLIGIILVIVVWAD
jgi:hypothetical protein